MSHAVADKSDNCMPVADRHFDPLVWTNEHRYPIGVGFCAEAM